MASIALVSIVSRDRVGLVSAISDHLFSAGINLRDTTFAVLGKGAEFTAICELPDGLTVGDLEAGLGRLPPPTGAPIPIAPHDFEPAPRPRGRGTPPLQRSRRDQ